MIWLKTLIFTIIVPGAIMALIPYLLLSKTPPSFAQIGPFQIFGMIVQGKTVTDIAAELSLSVKTVSTHKMRVLEKMNFTNQAELVRYALTHRLFDAPND